MADEENVLVQKKKKTAILFLACIVIALVIFLVLHFYVFSAAATTKYDKELSLARRYYEDVDYEKAVVAFHEAISIDPKAEEAYFGLVDVYLAMANSYMDEYYEFEANGDSVKAKEAYELAYAAFNNVNSVKGDYETSVGKQLPDDYLKKIEELEKIINGDEPQMEAITGDNSGASVENTQEGTNTEVSNVETVVESTEHQEVDSYMEYKATLDNIYGILIGTNTNNSNNDGLSGIWESAMWGQPADNLSTIGYAFVDIDNNGTEELIVAQSFGNDWPCDILNIYTISDNKVVMLAEGWSRNRYYLLNDGTVYNEGSNGADDSSFISYKIADDKKSLAVVGTGMKDYQNSAKKLNLVMFVNYEY